LYKNIWNFFITSYKLNKIAFLCEMLSTILYVFISIIMTLTALHPNMVLLYPIYSIASISSIISSYRRNLFWPLGLSIFFTVTNILGYFIAKHMI